MKRGAALQIAMEGALCIRRLANAFRQSLTAPGSLFCTGTEMQIPCGTDMLFSGGEPNAMGQTAELNNAVEYIESHLGGEIDIAQAARLAVCSSFHFQRVSPVWPALH